MATAMQSQSALAQKQARLQAVQKSENERIQQNDFVTKERQKQETWAKVLEDHEKQVSEAQNLIKEEKKVVFKAPKPAILKPVRHNIC